MNNLFKNIGKKSKKALFTQLNSKKKKYSSKRLFSFNNKTQKFDFK